ncbi:unnamed protein product [Allacma fusca]|uniref:Uncharacterized protein n=1 Tax=Allacma fusca TaxID=39272 RepID=A0A8J2KUR1_9HEXA|nr:unnamed protein product [Allacma fusca]
MEPGEPSFDLSAIIIEKNAEEQVVPLLFDPLAEAYVVEMSGPLDENIADNKSQCFVGCSLNEKGEMLRIQGTYIKELEHKLTQAISVQCGVLQDTYGEWLLEYAEVLSP